MNKLFTLLFALTLFTSGAFAQCDDIIDVDVVSSGRINITFVSDAASDAFLAAHAGAVTADPGGTGTLENWNARSNKLRILGLQTAVVGPFSGTITFASGLTCSFNVGALPVSLTTFTGKKMEKSIQLEWETASELNNDYFAVERSVDGRNFKQLTEVLGKGNSTERVAYSFKDDQPESATNYYRLRQVDFDGTETFSEIISVKYQNTRLDLNIYPTAVQEELNVNLSSFENEAVTISILDVRGQILLNKAVNNNGVITLNLSDLNLNQGMYFVRCQSVDQVTSGKFLVVK